MLIHAAFPVCGIRHIRVLQNVVLQIHYRKLATDKQNSVAVVEHSHFVRGKQLTTGNLIVGRVVSASPLAFPVGVCINRFLAQKLGHILVRTLLIAAEIEKFIAVAYDGFPLLLKQSL